MSNKLTLVDQIYLNIKNDITKKSLPPGEKINIKELTRKYNVSDTPVKQALNRLIAENMVISIPNKGMSVRAFTVEEMNEIFDMRLMMDLYFMKDVLSTLSFNKTLNEQLQRNLEEHSAIVAQTPSAESNGKYYYLDSEFHQLYLVGSGNKKAIETFRNLNPFMYSTYTYIQQPHHRDKECVEEHKAIFDALLKQDIEALEIAIKTHIQNSRKTMQLIFKVNQII